MTDYDVIQTMIAHGGSFVSALGNVAARADAENLARIKETWPEIWDHYRNVSEHFKQHYREEALHDESMQAVWQQHNERE